MKRKQRRQLKENDLLASINKLFSFISRNRNKVIGVAVVVVFVVAVFIGVKVIKSITIKKEAKLLTDLFEIKSELQNNPDKIYELKELAGNGRYSRVAYIIMAGYWIEEGELGKAEDALKKIKKKRKDLFYYQSQDMLAQIYQKQDKYDKAMEIYRTIENENPKEYAMDVILFRLAKVHEKEGDIQKALSLYKKIEAEYPQTYYGYDASLKVEQLQKINN